MKKASIVYTGSDCQKSSFSSIGVSNARPYDSVKCKIICRGDQWSPVIFKSGCENFKSHEYDTSS